MLSINTLALSPEPNPSKKQEVHMSRFSMRQSFLLTETETEPREVIFFCSPVNQCVTGRGLEGTHLSLSENTTSCQGKLTQLKWLMRLSHSQLHTTHTTHTYTHYTHHTHLHTTHTTHTHAHAHAHALSHIHLRNILSVTFILKFPPSWRKLTD